MSSEWDTFSWRVCVEGWGSRHLTHVADPSTPSLSTPKLPEHVTTYRHYSTVYSTCKGQIMIQSDRTDRVRSHLKERYLQTEKKNTKDDPEKQWRGRMTTLTEQGLAASILASLRVSTSVLKNRINVEHQQRGWGWRASLRCGIQRTGTRTLIEIRPYMP